MSTKPKHLSPSKRTASKKSAGASRSPSHSASTKEATRRAPAKAPSRSASAKEATRNAPAKAPSRSASAKEATRNAPAKAPSRSASTKEATRNAPAKAPSRSAAAKEATRNAPAKAPSRSTATKARPRLVLTPALTRRVLIAALVVLAVVGGTAGVYALLKQDTPPVTNEYRAAVVTCDVNEDGSAANTGNIPVRVRAKVVANWVDEEGNVLFAPEGYSYTLAPGEGWTESGGYYYYNSPVAPDASTAKPVTVEKTLPETPAYDLQVTVLAEAIQATPAEAAQEAWGYSW